MECLILPTSRFGRWRRIIPMGRRSMHKDDLTSISKDNLSLRLTIALPEGPMEYIILPTSRFGRSRWIIPMERRSMQKDDLPSISKDDPSRRPMSPEDAYWAEQMKPSRQRNLTPSQRKQRAETLRLFRRDVSARTSAGSDTTK